MYVSTRALVIRSVPYKDADRILTVLSDKLGRITVRARGAVRKNSTLSSASQLFCCSDMVLFEKDGRYTLNEAHITEQFEGLRADLHAMSLASYFAEVLSSQEEDDTLGSSELLRLALNCLYALSSGKYHRELVKAAFELRYMTLSGYEPDLNCCALCGCLLSGDTRSLPEKGEIYCLECAPRYGVELSLCALTAARHFVSCELKKLLQVSVSEQDAQSLSEFSGRYLKSCLERGFKTLDFYYSLGEIR